MIVVPTEDEEMAIRQKNFADLKNHDLISFYRQTERVYAIAMEVGKNGHEWKLIELTAANRARIAAGETPITTSLSLAEMRLLDRSST